MDFSWGTIDGPAALWAVDLGLVSEPGCVPSKALRKIGARDLGEGLGAVASWGGAALALAAWKITPGATLALAVGRAVRAGQATASRASVIARSPLTGHLNQGQVGSDLARRLGALCDGLLLCGVTPVPDAVLVLRQHGGFQLHSIPGLKALGTHQVAGVLCERFGEASVLRPGPAAHAGVLWSNLCAGQDPASFVGSGGLGAVLAHTGLTAIVVCAAPVHASSGADEWLQSLMRSPRLIARAEGQPLREADRDPTPEKDLERHGCSGCPTPCGFVLERPDRSKASARFSALRPLMDLAGEPEGHGIQDVLQVCNDLGVDAREAAACLQLFLQHDEREGLPLTVLLQRLCLGEMGPASFREGALSLARHYGVAAPASHVQGQRLRPAPDPIHNLAQHLGVRGTEPLRSYPFLVGQQTGSGRMRSIVAPMHLPAGSEALASTLGKGRLLWWHENLICGVDVFGVCAFSVAALLSDGVFHLSELGERVLPTGLRVEGAKDQGEALLAVGANTLLLFRELDFEGRPAGALASHTLENVAPELREQGEHYLRLRGLRPDGHPDPQPLTGLGRAEWTRIPPSLVGGGLDERTQLCTSGSGGEDLVGVELRFLGALEPRLGDGLCMLLKGRPTLAQALQAVSGLYPGSEHWLLVRGQPVPAVMRREQQLQGDHLLDHGDVLELVLVISGG